MLHSGEPKLRKMPVPGASSFRKNNGKERRLLRLLRPPGWRSSSASKRPSKKLLESLPRLKLPEWQRYGASKWKLNNLLSSKRGNRGLKKSVRLRKRRPQREGHRLKNMLKSSARECRNRRKPRGLLKRRDRQRWSGSLR